MSDPTIPRLGEHDDVVALRHRREVAVHHRRMREDAVGGQPVQPVPQPRASFGLHQLLVRRALAAAHAAQPPLPEEQRALVEQARVIGHRDALDDPAAPERRGRAPRRRRRRRTAPAPRPVSPWLCVRRQCVSTVRGAPYVRLPSRAPRQPPGCRCRRRHAALGGHDGVHQAQALERVTRVMHFAFVDFGEIVLDVATGQRRPAEQHRELLGDACGCSSPRGSPSSPPST